MLWPCLRGVQESKQTRLPKQRKATHETVDAILLDPFDGCRLQCHTASHRPRCDRRGRCPAHRMAPERATEQAGILGRLHRCRRRAEGRMASEHLPEQTCGMGRFDRCWSDQPGVASIRLWSEQSRLPRRGQGPAKHRSYRRRRLRTSSRRAPMTWIGRPSRRSALHSRASGSCQPLRPRTGRPLANA